MTLLATFSLPAAAFTLGPVLDLDDVDRIEVDCTIPARDGTMPYFWVWGSDLEGVQSALDAEPSIDSVTLVDELEEARLYRAEWDAAVSDVLGATRVSGGVLREVAGVDDWTLELLFEEREDMQQFATHFETDSVDVELERLYYLSDALDDDYGLTPAQREALVTAERAGFYDEPRELTMEELAHELDLSLPAVSGRLRRGTSTLVRNTLLP